MRASKQQFVVAYFHFGSEVDLFLEGDGAAALHLVEKGERVVVVLLANGGE